MIAPNCRALILFTSAKSAVLDLMVRWTNADGATLPPIALKADPPRSTSSMEITNRVAPRTSGLGLYIETNTLCVSKVFRKRRAVMTDFLIVNTPFVTRVVF